jgi:hypothetical protein
MVLGTCEGLGYVLSSDANCRNYERLATLNMKKKKQYGQTYNTPYNFHTSLSLYICADAAAEEEAPSV